MLDYYRVLIADDARTSAYREALRQSVKPGDVVVDIGTGVGILALFACEFGARHVYAIEKGDVAAAAEYLVRQRGLADRITVIHGDSRDVTLPEPADVIVTETLGMLGFDEGLLGTIVDARMRFARAGATLIPQRVRVLLAPVADVNLATWWSGPHHGIDLSPLQQFAANTIHPFDASIEELLADGAIVLDVDIATAPQFVSGSATFTAPRDATLTGFAGWFEATLAANIAITNGRGSPTHWSRSFLPLREPIELHAGDGIDVTLACNDGQLWRWNGTAAGRPFDQSTAFAMPRKLRE
jgi:hypothetical protein